MATTHSRRDGRASGQVGSSDNDVTLASSNDLRLAIQIKCVRKEESFVFTQRREELGKILL